MFNKKQSSERPERVEMETPPPAAIAPRERERPASTTAGASTVLAHGSTFVGKAQVAGTFRIEGRCEGDVHADECLVIGKSGDVEATVSARRTVLNGKFHGKIDAAERVEMQTGSRVEADIRAKHMVMEDGVQFRGNCEIGH
jgi:cytoskeletal protein CcmA (bactofilin family)